MAPLRILEVSYDERDRKVTQLAQPIRERSMIIDDVTD